MQGRASAKEESLPSTKEAPAGRTFAKEGPLPEAPKHLCQEELLPEESLPGKAFTKERIIAEKNL